MWFLWLMLILTVAGYFIYRTDRKIKSKFDDKFNPHEWALPRSFEVKMDSVPQPIAAPDANVKLGYSRKASVLSDVQGPIYKALQQAIGNDYFLLTNINAADVLIISPKGDLAVFQAATKNLATKQFDFLVCDKHQLRALCAITLGDQFDPLLESVCENAQLPFARFKVRAVYDVAVIRASLLNALGVEPVAIRAPDDSGLEISDAPAEQLKAEKSRMVENAIALEQCPECAAVMLKRKAKTGSSAGKLFWICSNYPKCRGILRVK